MKQDTLEGRARSKNGVKRLCFSVFCILLEAAFIVMMITKLNEYAEIVNLITRLFAGVLVLALYASDKTSSMKMPWVILILIFPIMGVALYLLIGLNGGTRKMRERYADIDRKLLPLLPDNVACLEKMKDVYKRQDINKQLEEGMMEYEKVSRQILEGGTYNDPYHIEPIELTKKRQRKIFLVQHLLGWARYLF